MIRNNAIAIGLGLIAIAGCYRDDFKLTSAMVEIGERQNMAFPANPPKKIMAMQPDDVIVAINGYPLTKQTYDDMMLLKETGLMTDKDTSQIVAQKMMDQYRVSYIKNFIGQRLLVDNAFALGIATTNEVLSEVEAAIKKQARNRGKKVAEFIRRFKGRERCFYYEIYVSHIIDRIIHEKIPPKTVVDENFTAAVQKQVDIQNATAEATNKLYKARLEYYKQQIANEKLDFQSVVRAFTGDKDADGVWGEFEADDLTDPRVRAPVFALREGEVSDVLEDDDGFHLVKVLKIIPPEKDEEGRVITREKRTLSQIYIEKEPLIIRQSDILMTADLKRQMQLRAVNEYVTGLSTNSLNKIEYPNGRDLF